jgi:hypothetical protein
MSYMPESGRSPSSDWHEISDIRMWNSFEELVRICKSMAIPRPSGGYWHRLAHGGASEQLPLPMASAGQPTQIPHGNGPQEGEAALSNELTENNDATTAENKTVLAASALIADTATNSPSTHLQIGPANPERPLQLSLRGSNFTWRFGANLA